MQAEWIGRAITWLGLGGKRLPGTYFGNGTLSLGAAQLKIPLSSFSPLSFFACLCEATSLYKATAIPLNNGSLLLCLVQTTEAPVDEPSGSRQPKQREVKGKCSLMEYPDRPVPLTLEL